MLYEVTGKVVEVLPIVSGTSAKGEWKKGTVVISFQDGQYENKLALDSMKQAEGLCAIPVGTEVKFKFSVQSRESNSRWYTSLNVVSWDVISSAESGNVPF